MTASLPESPVQPFHQHYGVETIHTDTETVHETVHLNTVHTDPVCPNVASEDVMSPNSAGSKSSKSGTQGEAAKAVFWNTLALVYLIGGYGCSLACLISPNGWLKAIGVLWLTHVLVYSAYLSHEFMHSTIVTRRWLLGVRQWNALGGNLMLWLNGGCYARFDDLARIHIAHHIDRVDFSAFDLGQWLEALPTPLQRLILALEWCYFPAISLMLRWRAIAAPFYTEARRSERGRTVVVLLTRGTLFAGLAWMSWKALILYFVAYVGMIQVLRFMDAFQHTYEVFPLGTPLPSRDYDHEQANTFSNVVSLRYPWLNGLLLNFGYHNAHHHAMKCPWYRLPALDRELFGEGTVRHIPLHQLLGNFHRFRLKRIFSGQGQAVDAQERLTLDQFYGGIEVSFLILL